MKAGWERSNDLIIPAIPTIGDMLKPFLKEKGIGHVQILSGGLNNTNIKIITNSKDQFVLRIFDKNNESIKIEKEILTLLKDRVPVPQVLYSDFSCTVFNKPFVLMNWKTGIQLSEVLQKNSTLQSGAATTVGSTLACIHKIRFPHSGFFNDKLEVKENVRISSDLFLQLIRGCIHDGYGKRHLGPDLSDKILSFTNENGHLMDYLGDQNSLVHSDFNPLNILVNEKVDSLTISAILDWEYAFSGSPLTDIGNMLRYEGITTKGLLEPFIVSYIKSGGSLPEKWLRKSKLLDLLALCDLANSRECGVVRIMDIKRLVLRTLGEWENYEDVEKMF
ncbi:aminoglycoside phosphotransferase family protein [Bacillus sp. BHET2]|uniref:phosphotransferase family protein n=1 Tax=Bacillus sp. BHET2 TaxID=2583818 RepID=UPI00110E5F60|nr:aminoglycoside phosphotransferase family protein [Bacillus sp. BHET2]TMU87532.1 aminoglycoside phosphotransferase family protein [Bacillus sp. BHET2]